ncbi:MAG: T9SS type A sorting domain-containing protein [Flavobacteriales bacterium]|nr:T9SS type A sorting domain-containing protein [Flavobacteriales bacterium]
MKRNYIIVLILIVSINISAQTVNYDEFNLFIENQKTPFLESNGETFILGNTNWERIYGEKEYVLTPLVQNVEDYFNRIRANDNPSLGIFKSTFSFINVEVTNSSKTLLEDFNIYVPDYIQNNVNVYLPQIDIAILVDNNIYFTYLKNYGKNQILINKNNTNQTGKASIYSEDFESTSVPSASLSNDAVGASNCSWKDVSCVSKSGFWSVWCAGYGAACNSSCSNSDYVNGMNSSMWKPTLINTTGYSGLTFSWWMNFDMNDVEVADILYRLYNFGTGWQLSSFSYNSSSTGEGGGYVYNAFSITGSPTGYSFQFTFISDGSFNSKGVYIDDISLTGNSTIGINDIENDNNISIYPNPTNNIINISGKEMELIRVKDVLGKILFSNTVTSDKIKIDLTSYNKGIYFVEVETINSKSIEKIIKQ